MSEAPSDLREYSDWLRLTAEAYPEDDVGVDSSKGYSELNTTYMLMLLGNSVPSPTIPQQLESRKEEQARSTAAPLSLLCDSSYEANHQLQQQSWRLTVNTHNNFSAHVEPPLNVEAEALLVKGFRRVERTIERIEILTKKHGRMIRLRDAVKAVDLLHKTTSWLEELGELVVNHGQQQQSSPVPQHPSIKVTEHASQSPLWNRGDNEPGRLGDGDGKDDNETGVALSWPTEVTNPSSLQSRPCWPQIIRSKILTLRCLVKRIEESGYVER